MYEVILLHTLTITLITIVSCLILAYMSLTNIAFEKRQKIRFSIAFSVIALIAICDISSFAIENSGNGSLWVLDSVINYFGFLLGPIIPLLLARTLLNGKQSPMPYYLYLAYAVNLAIFTGLGFVFNVDKTDATYQRNVFFYMLYIPAYIISFGYLFVTTIIINLKSLSTHPILYIFLLLALVGGMLVQTFKPDVHINFLIVCVTTVIFYTYITTIWTQIDGLTGLYNQFCFIQMVKKSKEGDYLFMMDADDFKVVNDTYGHLEGDRVLKEIAKIVQSTFGKSGKCFRLGGDEFVAIIHKHIDPDELAALFNARILEERQNLHCSVSMGYTKYEKGEQIIDVAKRVDRIMYKDKAIRKHDNHYKAGK